MFVGERLPSIRRRTYPENKAASVAFWFWKFQFQCGKIFELCGSWPPRNNCVGFHGALPCVAAHWPGHISCLCVHPAQSRKLPCLGTDTNIHQACWGLGYCDGRSWKQARKALVCSFITAYGRYLMQHFLYSALLVPLGIFPFRFNPTYTIY